QRRGRAYVEGLRPVAPRAARVEHVGASRFQPNHVLPQNRGSSGNLGGGLALHAQGNQHRRNFRLAPVPGYDLTDREAHLRGAQVAALDQRGKTLGESQGWYGYRRGHGALEASLKPPPQSVENSRVRAPLQRFLFFCERASNILRFTS